MARSPVAGSPPKGGRPVRPGRPGQAGKAGKAGTVGTVGTAGRTSAPNPRPDRLDRRMPRVVAGIVVGAAAMVVAVLAAIVSRMIWRSDVLSVPWGLLLATAASVAVVLAARAYAEGLAFLAAGVWIVATGLVLAGRPEGDYLFAQDGLGLGYLGIATVAVMGAAAVGRRPR